MYIFSETNNGSSSKYNTIIMFSKMLYFLIIKPIPIISN